MDADGWLNDIRVSYDAVAASYSDQLRGALDGEPYLRAALALVADMVRDGGGGSVADLGCGPGHITAHLQQLGISAFGIDLSPAMIDVARHSYPGLRFETGSMTDLRLADASVAGLLSFWSLVHTPDDEIPAVFAQFRRVLRPGGPLLLGFHAGQGSRLKTQGYGGHSMKVYVHRRQPDQVAASLGTAGFTVEAQLLLGPADSVDGALLSPAATPEPFNRQGSPGGVPRRGPPYGPAAMRSVAPRVLSWVFRVPRTRPAPGLRDPAPRITRTPQPGRPCGPARRRPSRFGRHFQR
jgi:SAM-dependent methyltransferase